MQKLGEKKEEQVRFGDREVEPPRYQGVETYSVYITVRDGVKLAADISLPENLPEGRRIPVLLVQTRYWRSFEMRAPFKWFLKPEILNPYFRDFKPFFTSHGYAIVTVDVRGTGASFGSWPHPWDRESTLDASDIIDWIINQSWSDGQVGAYGTSYMGTTAELVSVLNHPAVKATIPMFNHPDPYADITFPGGLFNLRFIKAWSNLDSTLDQNHPPGDYGVLGRIFTKGVKPVDDDVDRALLEEAVREHENNGSAYFQALGIDCRNDISAGTDLSSEDICVHQFDEQLRESGAGVCGWGSWMDAGTADAVLRRFQTYENARMGVIGAWDHGGRFNASPYRSSKEPADPPLPGQWKEMMRFFDAYLKHLNNGVQVGKALYYYTMGEEQWKCTDCWPPDGTKFQRWYLAENNELSTSAPESHSGADKYEVDFNASTGTQNRWWELGAVYNKTVDYGDRAGADRRLLAYTSQPLESNVEITGHPIVTLFVTSTATDGAFFVYLEDVGKDGRVHYVTEGLLRAVHRKVSNETSPYQLQVPYHSFKLEDLMPLAPGEVAELKFGMLPTSVLIRKEHRIRIAIAGHDKDTFPRIPSVGVPVISVLRNQVYASYVDLPVLEK